MRRRTSGRAAADAQSRPAWIKPKNLDVVRRLSLPMGAIEVRAGQASWPHPPLQAGSAPLQGYRADRALEGKLNPCTSPASPHPMPSATAR